MDTVKKKSEEGSSAFSFFLPGSLPSVTENTNKTGSTTATRGNIRNREEFEEEDEEKTHLGEDEDSDLEEFEKRLDHEDVEEGDTRASKKQRLDTTTNTATETSEATTKETVDNQEETENERTRRIIRRFTPEQERRYEKYRRSRFKGASIKRVMQNFTNSNVNQTMCIFMGGITKMYVGELVEHAKIIMDEWGESGPIQPKHLREAYRRISKQNKPPKKIVKR